MRECHPNGVQGHRPISAKNNKKREKHMQNLTKFLRQKPAK